MKLVKLRYHDDQTNLPLPNMQKRVEFFFHYWSFLFEKRPVSLDENYLKSHRTIINKVRLQVDGNFAHASQRVKTFLVDDECFSFSDPIIKEIMGTPIRRAMNSFTKFTKTKNNWKTSARKIDFQLTKLQHWLTNEYTKQVTKATIKILTKDADLTPNDRKSIMKLVNYLIIEMFNKGYDKKFISDVPHNLYDTEFYPYERERSSFATKEAYQEYKNRVWQTLTLEEQISSLKRLVEHPQKTHQLIYRIENINFRIQPITVLGVEFYNPFHSPKVQVTQDGLINEKFSITKEPKYEESSNCNALVEVSGVPGNKLYIEGYEKVRSALAFLNSSLNLHGKVSALGVLHTNIQLSQVWGSSMAIFGGLKALDQITPFQNQTLADFNRLTLPRDQEIVNLLTDFYEEKTLPDSYNPHRLWTILEANFVDQNAESEIQEFFFNSYKRYIKYNLLPNWELFFIKTLNRHYSGSNPEDYYELDESQIIQLEWTEIDEIKLGTKRFVSKLPMISSFLTDVPFIKQQIDHIESYFLDRLAFNNRLEKWIKYHVTELYAQRNLKVHSNMSDELFLLKQQETLQLIDVIINLFTYEYLKHGKRKSMIEIVKKINGMGASL